MNILFEDDQFPAADHCKDDTAFSHIIHPLSFDHGSSPVQVIDNLIPDLFMLVGDNKQAFFIIYTFQHSVNNLSGDIDHDP